MKTKIFSDQFAVDSRLEQFGLNRGIFHAVMEAAKMGFNMPTENFPNGSRGTLSWMMGTSQIREELISIGGWDRDSLDNVSWVINHTLGMRIAILNADQSVCDEKNFPQPHSRKGAATESATSSNQQLLSDILDNSLNQNWSDSNSARWYFMVYCDGEEIRGELSLPTGFSNGYFTEYAERIFVGKYDGSRPGDKVRKISPDSGPDEFEIPVIRKKAV